MITMIRTVVVSMAFLCPEQSVSLGTWVPLALHLTLTAAFCCRLSEPTGRETRAHITLAHGYVRYV